MVDVSVIIPTWNRAETIERAVRSALDQTNSPLEVLVCDDGSTDNTLEVIQSINDPRVRWIAGTRGGRPAIPRNRGIRESRGEWLAFLDSDDEWLPDKLEKQLGLAKRLGCKAACGNATRYVPGEGPMGAYLSWKKDRVTFDDLLCVNQVICSSALVHKSLLAAAVGFPEDEQLKALEDYALWLRIATQTDFVFVAEPLLIYRDDAVNSIRGEKADLRNQRRAVFNDFKRWGRTYCISGAYLRKTARQSLIDLLNRGKAMLIEQAIRLKKAFLK